MGRWDQEEIRTLFLSLEFRSLLERLVDVRREPLPAAATEFVARVGGGTDLARIAKAAAKGARVAVASRPGSPGVALALSDDEAVWLDDAGAANDLLADVSVAKVAHDAKEIDVARRRAGGSFAGLAFDTKIAAFLLDPAPGRYDLEELTVRYLDRELPSAKPSDDHAQLSLDVEEAGVAESAAAHAAALLPLADRLSSELERLGMAELYRDVELPLIEVLAGMEEVGVAVDVALLEQQGNKLSTQIDAL
jgi:DNA polymerase-1